MVIKKDTLDQLLAGRDPQDVFARDGLVDELKKALANRVLSALVLGDQLRIKRPLPVSRNAKLQLRPLAQNRLLRIAVPTIGLTGRRLADEVIVQLRR